MISRILRNTNVIALTACALFVASGSMAQKPSAPAPKTATGTAVAVPNTKPGMDKGMDKGAKSPAPAGQMPAGRSVAPPPPPQEIKYADSVAFKAAWKQLYPIIKPSRSLVERLDLDFRSPANQRTFKVREVDSVLAYKKCKEALDTNMMEQTYFKTYRKEFTAEQLKQVAAFLQTPAGTHFFLVANSLVTVPKTQIDTYVHGVVQKTVAPLMKPFKPPVPGSPEAMRPGAPIYDSLGHVKKDAQGHPMFNPRSVVKVGGTSAPSGTVPRADSTGKAK